MQQEATVTYPSLHPRSGVLVVDGYGIAVRVHRGRLVVSDGIGRERRTHELARASRKVRRLVLVGHTGYLTLEAIRWLSDVGIGFCHIDKDGRLIATSAFAGRDDPRLRRSQALAAFTQTGVEIARGLIERKIQGEVAALASREPVAADRVASFLPALGSASSLDDIRQVEAAAALVYWQRLATTKLTFSKESLARIPEHWRTLGERRSGLGAGARAATTPGNAVLNYCFTLGLVESQIALSAIGLDVGLGILHTDQKRRPSMALDVVEVIRPKIEAWALDVFDSTTFTVGDFHETRQGVCRLLAPLTHSLAQTLPMWRQLIAPVAEHVAATLSQEDFFNPAAASRAPGRAVGDARDRPPSSPIRYREMTGDPAVATLDEPRGRILKRCLVCAVDLPYGSRRKVCVACLPAYELTRTAKLSTAGARALAKMRASVEDPAQTAEAKKRRATKLSERMRAIRAWESSNGKVHDWSCYDSEVLPLIVTMTVPELMRLTGLSEHYCWQVRARKKRLHPMHWGILVAFARARQLVSPGP